MSCPECGEASPDSERTKCAGCGYEFVFRPSIDGTSDNEWLSLLGRVSEDGRHYFTSNQLYCCYARGRVVVTRYISRRGRLGLVMIALGLSIWVYALKVDWGLTLVAGIAITLTGVAQVGTGVVTRREPAAREPLMRLLQTWLAKKPLPALLGELELKNAGIELSPERVEWLLIVERDSLVDLLTKNGAPQQLSALVVSESGYPKGLALEAQRLLDERSDLKVVALHDATRAGVSLNARLQTSTVLTLAGKPILDAGLFAAEVSQIEELTAAYPASHVTEVPVDALSFGTLLAGLRGLTRGALSISAGIFEQAES